MKIRSKIFLGIFCIVGSGFYFLIDWLVDDLTPRYRESTEEPLVDAARILASFVAVQSDGTSIDTDLFRRAFADAYSRAFEARIYDFVKTNVDYRVYITDREGKVIFDSDNRRDEGKDYSTWRDVSLTLSGEYGARTSRDTPLGPTASVLYVAAPIIVQGNPIGVLTVGKPTHNANLFIESAKRKIVVGGISVSLAMLFVGLLLSHVLTQPIQRLTEYAQAVRDGRRAQLPPLHGSEIIALGTAFEEMKEALEGKQYIENYIQTLTHEIKSPLSAIRGAAELLGEDMPAERRKQFFDNILVEGQRIQTLVDKMLLLSSVEARRGPLELEEIDIRLILDEAIATIRPGLEKKHISLVADEVQEARSRGEKFLLYHAILNVLQNALEFSPSGSSVAVSLKADGGAILLTVSDQGPGIPEYASDRVFERFFSLHRPDTGKKSSGLGLSLVKEVMEVHGGTVAITNRVPQGAEVRITLPGR